MRFETVPSNQALHPGFDLRTGSGQRCEPA